MPSSSIWNFQCPLHPILNEQSYLCYAVACVLAAFIVVIAVRWFGLSLSQTRRYFVVESHERFEYSFIGLVDFFQEKVLKIVHAKF